MLRHIQQSLLKARVGGDLTHVYFREGQDVNKGDMLFTIDPRLFKTALDSAKANLVRDTALAKKPMRIYAAIPSCYAMNWSAVLNMSRFLPMPRRLRPPWRRVKRP